MRKPLIIKGVRQTGKTYILKEFGKEFPQFHYLNFEHNKNAAALFEGNFEPTRILNDLSFLLQKSIDLKNDLVIFDEIQACPKALTSLKYFSEQMPELALCSAGSLLGLHLGENSFPVGKVDLLHMYPLCFAEFLEALNEEKSIEVLNQLDSSSSISAVVRTFMGAI